MANYVDFETVQVEEEKTPLYEKAADFLADHPAVAWSLYVVACLTVAIPACALYGTFVGRQAGKSAAKMLIEAGVKL